MERYHIFKLGLAILFYAAYCIRPMMVHGLKVDDTAGNSKNIPGEDYFVYYQGVQGKPGVDFPVLSHIPRTSFNCKILESGYYADLETNCQVFHICEDGKKISFLCPNGTIFDQTELICEWWFKVNCTTSPDFYEESAEQLRVENARRKAQRKQQTKQSSHGAVMRMEQQASVSAVRNGQKYQVNSQLPQRVTKKTETTQKPFNLANDINVNYKPQATRAPSHLVEVFNNTATQQNFQQYNEENKQQNAQNYISSSTSRPTTQSRRAPSHLVEVFNNTATQQNFQQYNEENKQQIAQNYIPSSTSRPTTQSRGQIKYAGSISNDINKPTKPQNIILKVSASLGSQRPVSTTRKPAQDRIIVQVRTDQQAVVKKSPAKELVYYPQNKDVFVNIRTNQQPATTVKKTDLGKESQPLKQQSTVPLTRNDITSRRLEPTESEESQIPQETASFYKNNYNSISQNYKPQNSYSNHRDTYSDLRDPKHYGNKVTSTLSSVTPHYLTTQPLNNGRPFIGSQVGTTFKSTTRSYSNLFNTGRTDRPFETTTIPTTTTALPTTAGSTFVTTPQTTESYTTVVTTTQPFVTTTAAAAARTPFKPNPYLPSSTQNQNSIYASTTKTPARESKIYKIKILPPPPPPNSFNLGETEKARSVDFATPIDIFNEKSFEPLTTTVRTVPPVGSLNVGSGTVRVPTAPPRPSSTTIRTIDHATVYGRYKATTEVPPTDGTIHGRVSKSTTALPLSASSNGFYVTKSGFDVYDRANFKDEIQKPRPFQLVSSSAEPPRQSKKLPDPHPFYKVSTASPFVAPTVTTLEPTQPTYSQPIENVDNMINALVEMAKQTEEDYSGETPRPGLVIPPSAGPQTLHTLAQYFANALDSIAASNDETAQDSNIDFNVEKERLTALLTKMTIDKYAELTQETTTHATTISEEDGDNDLEGQHSKNPAQSPRIRQLARVFTQALSSYLDDPDTFKKVLEEVRPTEPPLLEEVQTKGDDDTEDELLNFSDADAKSSYPPIFPTTPSVQPTWGYIIALNQSGPNLDVKNSINPEENLQLADSQSFVSQYNNLRNEEKTTTERSTDNLPENHWTASPGATKLWASTVALNPVSFNQDFGIVPTTEENRSHEEDATETDEELITAVPELQPHHEIQYEIRSLPQFSLNSTQVHGILIDYMNTTKSNHSNRLQRILRRLNTTEEEFLRKMREIENNPLTRRLILLLISECGDNATKSIKAETVPLHSLIERESKEVLDTSSSTNSNSRPFQKSSSHFKDTVDPSIVEDSQDDRALQLLNSLYSIASRFGKK